VTASRTTSEFAIRRCTVADAPLLAELAARLFIESYGSTHPEPERSRYLARAFSVEKVRGEIADKDVTMFIAENDASRPIAYAFLRKTSQLPEGVSNPNSFEIVRFYVEAAAQGKGVGAALMDQCLAESRQRGADLIWVQTWTQAPWAIGFYNRMGFRRVGAAPFYFGERIDDDQVMSRDL
jgi:diamine N-acetyltransferase